MTMPPHYIVRTCCGYLSYTVLHNQDAPWFPQTLPLWLALGIFTFFPVKLYHYKSLNTATTIFKGEHSGTGKNILKKNFKVEDGQKKWYLKIHLIHRLLLKFYVSIYLRSFPFFCCRVIKILCLFFYALSVSLNHL